MRLAARVSLWVVAAALAESALLLASCTTTLRRRDPPTFTYTHTTTSAASATATPDLSSSPTWTVPDTATPPNTPTATTTYPAPTAPTALHFHVGTLRLRGDFCAGAVTPWAIDGWAYDTTLCDPQGINNMLAVRATGVPLVNPTPVDTPLIGDTTSTGPFCREWGGQFTNLVALFPGPTKQPTPGDTFFVVVQQATPGSTPFPPITAQADFVAPSLPQITTNLCGNPGADFVVTWSYPPSGPPPDFHLVTVAVFPLLTPVWGPVAYLPPANWAFVQGLTPGDPYVLLVTAVWHSAVHPYAPDSGSHAFVFTD